MRVLTDTQIVDPQGKGYAIGRDGGLIAQQRVYEATIDFASTADTAASNIEVTGLTGVKLGDQVIGVSAKTIDIGDGVSLSGQVTAAGTVSVLLVNESGGVLDLASTLYRITVLQFQADE